jgi:hypothetical protein
MDENEYDPGAVQPCYSSCALGHRELRVTPRAAAVRPSSVHRRVRYCEHDVRTRHACGALGANTWCAKYGRCVVDGGVRRRRCARWHPTVTYLCALYAIAYGRGDRLDRPVPIEWYLLLLLLSTLFVSITPQWYIKGLSESIFK